MLVSQVLALLGLTSTPASSQPEEIITRDVAILGGGGTGSYAAVQLIDRGYSVAVVEQKHRLGGHADTLYLPNGDLIDYGIRAYFNESVVRDFFNKLHVEYESYWPSANNTDRVDFRTGARVPVSGDPVDPIPAILRYRAAIEQFNYLSTGGYFLPDPVPEALLRPFREFVEANDLQDALTVIWTFSEPLGDILEAPLLFVIQMFGISHMHGLLQGPYIRPRNGSAAIFKEAARYIGEDNIFYESTAIRTTRDSTGVEVVVENSDGRKRIRARKLLISFPPILPKLRGFDLNEKELSLFRKWKYTAYYGVIINNCGIPDGFNIVNTDPKLPGGLPAVPFASIVDFGEVSGYYRTRVIGTESFTGRDAKQLVLDDLRRMGAEQTFPINEDLEIVALESHWPTALTVPPDEARSGFYQKLYALQGRRSTYYTGYAFCTDYSPQLWNYTLNIVDMMVGDMRGSLESK
ncbi:uncharacterized protein DSM5745_05957 [Aspergillus mulundensis]|uniref:Amine oxidase domain-containing protein n=1 Tax=Aspergillus mulundensis TaxID=1810919 RepID=A0A3D8RYJ2_9EURO|nr:Uncharacterized protein DSM5745_05957 [Aspergillus mulundensis]RDW79105.1 Uncharacterized protein DSM5745_05957 [Aspergillus mulundensis]